MCFSIGMLWSFLEWRSLQILVPVGARVVRSGGVGLYGRPLSVPVRWAFMEVDLGVKIEDRCYWNDKVGSLEE